jgi:hypothetical protein
VCHLREAAALSRSSGERGDFAERLPREGWPFRLLLFLVLAGAAHLLLSRLGFNPTDDGFILAQSRRILEGQVPHRDFISIRPVGSALLHTLDLLGGDRTFLLSRLVYWLQAATICWCWLEIALAKSSLRAGPFVLAPLAVLSFMLTTHAFPPLAWHTVDAVWLTSLGLLACQVTSGRRRLVGYALVGAAVLCKQNFLPMLPLAVLAQGDARRPSAWLAVAAPAALYVAALATLGAFADLRQQMFAYRELAGSGVRRYLAAPGWPAGLVTGLVAGGAMALGRAGARSGAKAVAPWLGFVLLVAAIGSAGWTLDAEHFLYVDHMSFAVLGCLCGFLLASVRHPRNAPLVPVAALLAVLGWCSGISFGYQTPAHVAGPIAILLVVGGAGGLVDASRTRLVIAALLGAAVLGVAGHWWSARRDHIYNEATAPLLTHRLDGVLAGANGIVTNANTFAVLSDLRDLVARLKGRRYAIVVDVPGWWARSPQANPLPADWPQSMELHTLELQDRFSAHAVGLRGEVVFIVQKVQMTTLAEKIVPVGDRNAYYGAAVWIHHTFRQLEGSRYWGLYE